MRADARTALRAATFIVYGDGSSIVGIYASVYISAEGSVLSARRVSRNSMLSRLEFGGKPGVGQRRSGAERGSLAVCREADAERVDIGKLLLERRESKDCRHSDE